MVIRLIQATLAIIILAFFLFLVILGYMSIILKLGDELEKEEEQYNNNNVK